MSGHTPGPWAVEPSWSERCGGDVSIVNREHMGDDWDVCIVYSSEANARLIAAAPLMVAELIRLKGVLNGAGYATEATDAVIAAATGEQA